jgi:hypothetical protein
MKSKGVDKAQVQPEVIRCIPISCKLPELNETILIFRCNDCNEDHVSLAYRRHKSVLSLIASGNSLWMKLT